MESLRHMRELAGYSQQELANESGVSQHTISEIELGRRRPQGRTLRKLAKVLKVEVADLRGNPEHPLGKAPPSTNQPPLNGFEEERRFPSLRSWIDFAGRTADRWEAELKEREADWQAAEPHIRRNVKWLPNLSWATEIRSAYAGVLEAVSAELNYGFYVYEAAEVQELFKNTQRLEDTVERTEPWYQGEEAPRMAEVIDLQQAVVERVAQITARSSQSA